MNNIFKTRQALCDQLDQEIARNNLNKAIIAELQKTVMDLTIQLEQEQLDAGATCEFCQYMDRTKQQELERELGYMRHDLAEANERLDLSRKDTDHALKLASYYKHLVKAQELKEDLGL